MNVNKREESFPHRGAVGHAGPGPALASPARLSRAQQRSVTWEKTGASPRRPQDLGSAAPEGRRPWELVGVLPCLARSGSDPAAGTPAAPHGLEGLSKEDVVRSPSQPVAEEGAVLHVSALPPRSWGHAASAAARDEVMESVGSEG